MQKDQIYTNKELDDLNYQQLIRALQSLQSNINLRKRPDFTDTVDRLKVRIELKKLKLRAQSKRCRLNHKLAGYKDLHKHLSIGYTTEKIKNALEQLELLITELNKEIKEFEK